MALMIKEYKVTLDPNNPLGSGKITIEFVSDKLKCDMETVNALYTEAKWAWLVPCVKN